MHFNDKTKLILRFTIIKTQHVRLKPELAQGRTATDDDARSAVLSSASPALKQHCAP